MNTATNNIHTMVYMQREDQLDPSAEIPFSNPVTHSSISQTSLEENNPDSMALFLDSLRRYGREAESSMEAQLEVLQEKFLADLGHLLQKAEVTLEEKLTISLSENNTLLLLSAEENDALLEALGSTVGLREQFLVLRGMAVMTQGLHYLNMATESHEAPSLPEYRMCLKGALSHFYLKLA